MSASSDRFTKATPWDQQPALWVLTSLFMTWCFLGLVARVCIRRNAWLLADSVHSVACVRALHFTFGSVLAVLILEVLGIASWVALYVGLSRGAGKSPTRISSADYAAAGKAVFVSIIFAVLAKGVATTSHLLLLKHMLATPSHIRLCAKMIALCWAVYLAACLTVSVMCSPDDTLNTGERISCSAGVARWSVFLTLALSQVLMAAFLPAATFWGIQKPLRTRVNVISWFSVPPLVDIVPLSLALWQYSSSIHSEPSGTGLVRFLVYLNTSLCWNLLYPIIPALRPTALSYATGGAALTPEGSAAVWHGYGSNFSRSGTGRGFSSSKKLETDEMPLRPLASREDNHTSVGAGSTEDIGENGISGPPDSRTIHVTQEFAVVER